MKVRGGWVQLMRAGTPDVGGQLRPRGRAFAVECKLGKGKMRESQLAWAHDARQRGVLVLSCHDAGQIVQTVAALLAAQAER